MFPPQMDAYVLSVAVHRRRVVQEELQRRATAAVKNKGNSKLDCPWRKWPAHKKRQYASFACCGYYPFTFLSQAGSGLQEAWQLPCIQVEVGQLMPAQENDGRLGEGYKEQQEDPSPGASYPAG